MTCCEYRHRPRNQIRIKISPTIQLRLEIEKFCFSIVLLDRSISTVNATAPLIFLYNDQLTQPRLPQSEGMHIVTRLRVEYAVH